MQPQIQYMVVKQVWTQDTYGSKTLLASTWLEPTWIPLDLISKKKKKIENKLNNYPNQKFLWIKVSFLK
jgi:hypothetical protein